MDKPALRVLLIEDNPGDVRLMQLALSEAKRASFVVESAGTLEAAFQFLERQQVDIVLLDLSLPDSFGLQTFRTLQERWPQVPVVVLSGDEDESVATAAVNEGAQDFLVKGHADGDGVARAIRYAIERHRMLEQVRQLAILDPVTALTNRRGFRMLGQHHIELARRTKKPLTLLFIDVDGMKGINDAFGHSEGDRALMDTARLMVMTFRKSDVLGRLGGDEFAVLLTETTSEGPEVAVARFQDNVTAFNAGSRRGYTLGLSVGMARYDPESPSTLDELLAKGDQAMYREKRKPAA